MMINQPETPAEKVERLFNELASAADMELAAERNRITMEFQRAHSRGEYADAFSPGVMRMICSMPTKVSYGSKSGSFCNPLFEGQGESQCTMWGAIIGATYQLISGLPQVLAAPEQERLGKLLELIKNVVIAAGASGLTVYIAKRLEAFLTKNAQRILAVILTKKSAEEFLRKLLGVGCEVTATCSFFAATALKAFAGFYHAAISAWANVQGDKTTSEMEWEKMWSVLNLDNILRITISTASGVLASYLAPMIGTGYLSFLIPTILYFICEWIVELAIASKDRYQGWMNWLATWFMTYRGPQTWAGGAFAEFEKHIPESLKCSISYEIVVDPVRSLRTGHLYEREQLYRWLKMKGTDPIARGKACSLDYIASPCAAKHAMLIAKLLGARPSRVPIQECE